MDKSEGNNTLRWASLSIQPSCVLGFLVLVMTKPTITINRGKERRTPGRSLGWPGMPKAVRDRWFRIIFSLLFLLTFRLIFKSTNDQLELPQDRAGAPFVAMTDVSIRASIALLVALSRL